MFAGKDEDTGQDDAVYLAVNAYWEPRRIVLPLVPIECYWIPVVDTGRGPAAIIDGEEILDRREYVCAPRSVAVFVMKGRRGNSPDR